MTDQRSPIILYIEDNPDNRKLVRKVLAAAGFEIYTVSDGESGLAFVEETIPDLVLVDIGMPYMDGYEVTRLLRDNPSMDGVPIVAVTAHAMKGDEEKSLNAGCTGYIRKPIDVDRFPAEISAFLEPSPAATISISVNAGDS